MRSKGDGRLPAVNNTRVQSFTRNARPNIASSEGQAIARQWMVWRAV